MKKKLVVIFALFLLAACSNSASQDDTKPVANTEQAKVSQVQSSVFKSYPPAQVMELIKQRQDLFIIDVRSPEELSVGSISNSQLIPFTELAQGRMSLPTGKPLLLICAVGGRSYAVGQYFSGKGYGEIYNLAGGISAWKAAGLPMQPR